MKAGDLRLLPMLMGMFDFCTCPKPVAGGDGSTAQGKWCGVPLRDDPGEVADKMTTVAGHRVRDGRKSSADVLQGAAGGVHNCQV